MSYSSYDHDDLELASTMRIERRIYFESGKADLSEMVKLPLAELLSLRAESAAAEQEVFDRLKEQAAAWEEQAGKTLFLDKALEYARTLPVTHTANQWEAPDEYRHIRSNMVYQMDYSISENTRYDSTAKKSVPYSWTLRWGLYTNAPHGNQREKIAGQDRKVFANREELDRYLNGRIKAHDHYFTEISPAIPKEYADCFKVNGCLLPGYTIEGEEPAKAAALPTQEEAAQPQTAATPERREPVNEIFSIFLDNRAEAQTGGPHGYWLSLPTSAEQVQEALKEIHITADNQQDLFIGGFSAPEGKPLELPEDLIKAASVDELNFLAAQLQKLDVVELAELNAAMQSPAKMQTIGQLLDYAENTDCFVLINAKDNRSLGEYYLNDSGLFVVPDPWKPAIDTDLGCDLLCDQSAQIRGVLPPGVEQVVVQCVVHLVDPALDGMHQPAAADDGREGADVESAFAQRFEHEVFPPFELVADRRECGDLGGGVVDRQRKDGLRIFVDGDLRGGRARVNSQNDVAHGRGAYCRFGRGFQCVSGQPGRPVRWSTSWSGASRRAR